jgi:hypothetical protein
VRAGLAPDSFWEQVPASYNAAMGGALAARGEQAELSRDLALMTSYFAGRLAHVDWAKMPDWPQWLAAMTQPPRALTNAELIARFDALVARGHARVVN